MPITAYHGTASTFDRFEMGHTFADKGQGHISGKIGAFFSGCERIATTFALHPEVYDMGFDSYNGSRTLIRDPYQYSDEPWLPNAQVLTCDLHVTKPLVVSVVDWVDLVDRSNDGEFDGLPCPFQELREKALKEGCDHILIPAAKEGETCKWGGDFVVEYDSDVIVVLDPEMIRIVDRRPTEEVVPPRRSRSFGR